MALVEFDMAFATTIVYRGVSQHYNRETITFTIKPLGLCLATDCQNKSNGKVQHVWITAASMIKTDANTMLRVVTEKRKEEDSSADKNRKRNRRSERCY